jgi:hypothetical protein
MNHSSSGTAGESKALSESNEQRLLARIREERERRIIDYAAQMLDRLCHPLSRRSRVRRRGRGAGRA